MRTKRKSSANPTCLRILDANYNRAKEALRVCEDIVRFSVEDSKLTKRWKSCRHALTQTLLKFPVPYRTLVHFRGSERDVGQRSAMTDQKRKIRILDLLNANMKRSQEAMRVLEEFSKIVAPHQSEQFQKIRFKLYGLEKATYSKF